MAYETGTASDHTDFFGKLKAFLQGASMGAEAWATAWTAPGGASNPTDVVLRGPGLSGQDRVFVGLRLVADPTGADAYWIELRGMTGVLAAATKLEEHVGVQPNGVRILLDDGPMTYWFLGSGRRFIATAKISTIFESCYAGLFLPYGDPTTYPYPLFVGGSAGEYDPATSSASPITGWRSTAAGHRHFVTPYYSSPGFNGGMTPGAWMLSPGGDWFGVSSAATGMATTVGLHPEGPGSTVWPGSYNGVLGAMDFVSAAGPAFDGELPLFPITLLQLSPVEQTFGILDGAYRTAGFNNAAENIITAGGVDHLVIQNVFRTGVGDYWAMALENLQ